MERYFQKKFENDFSQVVIKKRLAEQIILKRKENFNKFPDSVKYIINIALMHKIKKVDKNNAEVIKKVVNSSAKNCLNPVCMGKLKADKCLLCDVTFCIYCEKPKNNSMHMCDKADLASLELIKKDSVSCPKCGTRITKSSGCNEMSCTMCGHHFNYRDPTLTSHGNPHNANFQYKGIRDLADIRNKFNNEPKKMLTNIINMKLGEYELFPIVQHKSNVTAMKAYEMKHKRKCFMVLYNKMIIRIHKYDDYELLNKKKIKYFYDILTNYFGTLEIKN